jgi:hypothetical protein
VGDTLSRDLPTYALKRGNWVRAGRFMVEVEEVSVAAGKPTSVIFHFDTPMSAAPGVTTATRRSACRKVNQSKFVPKRRKASF